MRGEGRKEGRLAAGADLYMKMSRLLATGLRQRKLASRKWPYGIPPGPDPGPPPPTGPRKSSSMPELARRVHASTDGPPPMADELSPPIPLPLPLPAVAKVGDARSVPSWTSCPASPCSSRGSGSRFVGLELDRHHVPRRSSSSFTGILRLRNPSFF